MSLIYTFAKDLKNYLEWDEETKLVDGTWLQVSGFGQRAEDDGMNLRWTNPDNVETRLLQGYEISYEIDKIKRVRRRIVRRDGVVLMGKKVS